jgi:hypothetical protein
MTELLEEVEVIVPLAVLGPDLLDGHPALLRMDEMRLVDVAEDAAGVQTLVGDAQLDHL